MALKAVLASLAGLAADVSKLYKQDGDRFVLDVEPTDGFALENIEGLKGTLGKEMKARKDAEKLLEQFKDLDPAAARAALDKIEKMKDWKPDDKVKEQIEQIKLDLEKKFGEEKKKLTDENVFLTGQLESALLTSVATAVISAEKGVPELLLPHIKSRTKVVRDGDKMRVEVLNAQGNPDFDVVNGQTVPKTVESLVKSMKGDKVFGRAFESSGSSGSGAGGSGGKGGGTTGADGVLRISRRDTVALQANQDKIATGKAVVIDD